LGVSPHIAGHGATASEALQETYLDFALT